MEPLKCTHSYLKHIRFKWNLIFGMRENNDALHSDEKQHIATNIDELQQVLTRFEEVNGTLSLLNVFFSGREHLCSYYIYFNENSEFEMYVENLK